MCSGFGIKAYNVAINSEALTRCLFLLPLHKAYIKRSSAANEAGRSYAMIKKQ
jgi:hypothetical protein